MWGFDNISEFSGKWSQLYDHGKPAKDKSYLSKYKIVLLSQGEVCVCVCEGAGG